MTFRQSVLCFLLLVAAAVLSSCGSSGSAQPTAVTFSNSPTTLHAGSTGNFSVTVTNDKLNAGVTWQVSCANTGQCGTLTASTASATYQAPVAIPAGGVVIAATSVANPSLSATDTITITPAVTLPDGTYVFQLSGQDTFNSSLSPFVVAGAFTVASGSITGGEQDYVDTQIATNAVGTQLSSNAAVMGGTVSITSGTITGGSADSNLQIVLNTNDTHNVDNDVETLTLTQSSTTNGKLSWFDNFAAGSGTLILQNASAAATLPSGGYAFMIGGFDSYDCATHFSGVIDIDDLGGTTGTISGNNTALDFGDCGFNLTGQTFSASTVAGTGSNGAPDQYGRVTFILNPNAQLPPFALAGYIVDSSTITLVELADSLAGTAGGTALAQNTADVGNFSSSNLSGLTYTVGSMGQDGNGFANFAGALTFNSDGSVSGTADYNDIAAQCSGTLAAPAGSFSVDPTGRVTLSNLIWTNTINGECTSPLGPSTLQFYLDGNGNALMATSNDFDDLNGVAYQQVSASATGGAYALGAMGTGPVSGEWSAVGPVVVSASGSVSGFTDLNYLGSSPTRDMSLSGSFTGTSGIVTGFGPDALSVPQPSNYIDIYPIDSKRAIAIETDSMQLGLIYLQWQN